MVREGETSDDELQQRPSCRSSCAATKSGCWYTNARLLAGSTADPGSHLTVTTLDIVHALLPKRSLEIYERSSAFGRSPLHNDTASPTRCRRRVVTNCSKVIREAASTVIAAVLPIYTPPSTRNVVL
jgi:hypothetical protein